MKIKIQGRNSTAVKTKAVNSNSSSKSRIRIKLNSPNRDRTDVSPNASGSKEGTSRITGLVNTLKETMFGPDETPRQPQAKVAVLDQFKGSSEPGVTTHGEAVEAVLAEQGGLSQRDIQRIDMSDSGGFLRGLLPGSGKSRTYEDGYADTINRVAEGMESLTADKDSKIKVANISLKASPSKPAADWWDSAQRSPAARKMFAENLGLNNPSDKELLQAIVNKSSDSFKNNDALKKAKQRYDQATRLAEKKGINTVVSAGNEGAFADTVRKMGIETDPDFFKNAFSNDSTTTVGAIDFDGRSTGYSTPEAGAELTARGNHLVQPFDGEKAEYLKGTSFSAPTVSSQLSELADAFPLDSPKARENLLKEYAQPMGDPQKSGRGQSDLQTIFPTLDRLIPRPE